MKKKLRFLFLEDVPSDVKMVEHALRKSGFQFQLKRVDTKKEFLDAIEKSRPDVILSDHGLPSFDGFAALALAQKRCPTIPFIFVTDGMGEEMTIKTFEEGATDYVLKSQLAKLGPAVQRALSGRSPRAIPAGAEVPQNLRRAVESVKDYAIVNLDAKGNINFWNAGAKELFGYTADEVMGKNFSMLFPVDDQRANWPERALKAAELRGRFEDETPRKTKQGKSINVHVNLTALKDSSGKLLGFVQVAHRVGTPVPVMRPLPTTEERYREMIENCPCAVMVINNDGEILYSNIAAAKLLRARNRDELLASTFQRISPPVNGRKILERIRDARRRGSGFVEHELIRLDGESVPVDIAAAKVMYQGRPQIEIVAHDITERKRAEQALRESEERLRAILNTAMDAIVSIDSDGCVQEWNPAAERIFLYPRASALGQPVDKLVVPDALRQTYRDGLTHYLMTGAGSLVGRPVELTLRRANGEEFRAELSITRNGSEEAYWCTVLVRDITERKKTQAALHESEERFRLLVEGVQEYALYALDKNGNVATWNAGAERLEGYAADEIIGKNFSVFFPPDEIAAGIPEMILERAKAEGRFLNEGWRVRKDGSRFWSRGVVTAVFDESGQLKGYSKIAHDRTRQKQSEEEILRLNATLEQRVAERTAQLEAANEELEAFSYSVSHDLRAPLRHIMGYIEILQSEAEGSLNESSRRHLETIASSARRMGELVDALLGFSRMSRAEMRQADVSLSVLVEQARRELSEEARGRKVEWKIAPLPKVRGDAFLLRQALVNLLENALKYTRPRNPARIEIGFEESADEYVIFVRDNGVGFDMRYADKLFGVFQRLHRANEFEGTGIGLANVRRIIHRHGGRTWAESKVNNGATFFFSLPKPRTEAT